MSGTEFLPSLEKLRRERIDDFRSPHKNWKQLAADGLLDQVVLQPDSFVTDKELRGVKHTYPDHLEVTTTIERDTLFWYPGKKEVAALYLQQRIPKAAQDQALEGFRAMNWKPPTTRKETATAIARQEGNIAPGELLFGYMDRGSIEKTKTTREQGPAFAKLGRILTEMNNIVSRTLPKWYAEQNRELKDVVKWQAYNRKHEVLPEYGGIPADLRILLTAFSTITVLKSCPASIHKDGGNARKDQTSFTCLTTVREDDGGGGGEFCFIEYGLRVPVKPGDILIGQTTREWHCNLSPVRGTKYSMVAYYRRNLANPKMWDTLRKRKQK